MKNYFVPAGQALMVLAALLMAPSQDARADGEAFVRILHGLSGTSKVDVRVDGEKRFNDLEFGGVSPYIRLDSGAHSVVISSNNPTRTILSVRRRFRPYDFHTLGVYGTLPRVRVLSVNDSLGNPAFERAQLTAYHLAPGLPPFDVVTYQPGGQILTLLKNVRYGQARRASIPAIPMTVRLVRRGVIFKTLKGASPRAGRKYALYAVGRPSRNFKALLDVTASQ